MALTGMAADLEMVVEVTEAAETEAMSTLRFLRTFIAVAEHGSFSEAAERVALTQAAVSFQMRALETELGRELFDRSGRLALINAAGRALLPEARRLLELYEQIRRPPISGDDLSGSVAIGAIVSCMGTLSKVVSGLKRDHTGLDIKVFSGKSTELADKVAQGELDAAFIVATGRRANTLAWHSGFEEPLVVVAPASTTALDAAEALERHPFLRFDRSQRTGVQIDRSLRRLGVRVDEFLELNAIETVVALIRQDVGASLLPLVRESYWLIDPALRVFSLGAAAATGREIGMIERRDHDKKTVTRLLKARFDQATTTASRLV